MADECEGCVGTSHRMWAGVDLDGKSDRTGRRTCDGISCSQPSSRKKQKNTEAGTTQCQPAQRREVRARERDGGEQGTGNRGEGLQPSEAQVDGTYGARI